MEINILEILFDIFRRTWYLWAILFGVPFLIKIFKLRIKGFTGEKSIAMLLATLKKDKYRVINNQTIKVGNISTQIDHIVISNFGIFVIETKNYKGWIFGKEHEDYWKQVIYKEKHNFKNPIKQNKYHIDMLKKFLKDYPGLFYYSIVVFLGEAELKINTNNAVMYPQEMLRRIKSFDAEVITDKVRDEIFEYLKLHRENNK